MLIAVLQEEIGSLLSNVCTYLDSADLIGKCRDVVIEYTPEILDMINNHIVSING